MAVTIGMGVCVIALVGGFIPFTSDNIPDDEVGGCICGGVCFAVVVAAAGFPFFFSIT